MFIRWVRSICYGFNRLLWLWWHRSYPYGFWRLQWLWRWRRWPLPNCPPWFEHCNWYLRLSISSYAVCFSNWSNWNSEAYFASFSLVSLFSSKANFINVFRLTSFFICALYRWFGPLTDFKAVHGAIHFRYFSL